VMWGRINDNILNAYSGVECVSLEAGES
jgi:hypothetical protein